METEIYFLLHSLGIGAKYRGFRYLAYGIALCMEDEDYLLRVSKTLYPKIAQTFQVSSSCVERDIRTAISVCWTRGNRDLLFSLSVHPVLTKPTNSEFFDILSSSIEILPCFSCLSSGGIKKTNTEKITLPRPIILGDMHGAEVFFL